MIELKDTLGIGWWLGTMSASICTLDRITLPIINTKTITVNTHIIQRDPQQYLAPLNPLQTDCLLVSWCSARS